MHVSRAAALDCKVHAKGTAGATVPVDIKTVPGGRGIGWSGPVESPSTRFEDNDVHCWELGPVGHCGLSDAHASTGELAIVLTVVDIAEVHRATTCM